MTWYHGCGYVAYGAVIPRCPQCHLLGTWANFPHRVDAPADPTTSARTSGHVARADRPPFPE